MYCGAQILGGMIAGALITFSLPRGWIAHMLLQNNSVLGYPNTNNAYSRWQGFLAELIGTMILVTGICLATETWQHKRERKGYFALCIGLILSTAIYGIGNISGGALNPARMLGPMMVSGTVQTFTLPYIGGTLCGAIIGALVYKIFLEFSETDHADEFDDFDGKKKGDEETDAQLKAEYDLAKKNE